MVLKYYLINNMYVEPYFLSIKIVINYIVIKKHDKNFPFKTRNNLKFIKIIFFSSNYCELYTHPLVLTNWVWL